MDDKPAKDRPTTYGSAGEEDVAKDLIRETDAVKDGTSDHGVRVQYIRPSLI